MKNTQGDIITLNMCTINDNHIMDGSQDKGHKRQFFFVILSHFMPFYSTNSLQNQNFEKMKEKKQTNEQTKKQNAWRYYNFTYVYHNDYHLMYGS